MISVKTDKASLITLLLFAIMGTAVGQVKLPLSSKQSKAFRAEFLEVAKRVDFGLEAVMVLENSFFENHTLFVVQHYAPRTSFFASFATDKKGNIIQLDSDEEIFRKFVQTQNIQIQSPNQAIEYTNLIHHLYTSPSRSCQILEKIEDIRFDENLDGERDATKRAFESKYRNVIRPMDVEREENCFIVSYYQTEHDWFEIVTVTIDEKGGFDKKVEILEKQIPFMFR